MKPLPSLQTIDRLLIVKTSSLGDVIHALPAVQAIRHAAPHLEIGWVIRRRCADLLRGCPLIDHLYVLPDKPTAGALLSLRRMLRRQGYQITLDLQGLLLSGVITYLSGAPVRVGWDRNREGNAHLMTHPVIPGRPAEVGIRHEVDLLLGFPQALGVTAAFDYFPAQEYLTGEGREKAEEWLQGLASPRIALNVGAARAYKRWPTEHWAALAQELSHSGASLIFVGDQKDRESVAEIKQRISSHAPVTDLSGLTTLRELAAALALCDLVVSGDTGPMHLAVAVGTPVVALFGATDPRRHGPYGIGHHVLSDSQAVAKSRPTPAQGEAAMRALLPGMAAESILAQLAKSHA